MDTRSLERGWTSATASVVNKIRFEIAFGEVIGQIESIEKLLSDLTGAPDNKLRLSNGKTYEYDFENRLTSVSNGIPVVYDGDGNGELT